MPKLYDMRTHARTHTDTRTHAHTHVSALRSRIRNHSSWVSLASWTFSAVCWLKGRCQLMAASSSATSWRPVLPTSYSHGHRRIPCLDQSHSSSARRHRDNKRRSCSPTTRRCRYPLLWRPNHPVGSWDLYSYRSSCYLRRRWEAMRSINVDEYQYNRCSVGENR